jgi:hypothetical protein
MGALPLKQTVCIPNNQPISAALNGSAAARV